MPYPSTPTLLLMVVRFFLPFRASARMRFSGMPHRPKPAVMLVAQSGTSRMESSDLARTLFNAEIVKEFHHGDILRLRSGQAPARRKQALQETVKGNGETTSLSMDPDLTPFLRDPVSPW